MSQYLKRHREDIGFDFAEDNEGNESLAAQADW